MILTFKSIKFKNFGSYFDAELNLQNKGICLVSGKNNCNLDNAISNGSGKSTIWSAICFALTGATISGVTSNLKNINSEEDTCWVELLFRADNNEYLVTRYHKPKSDLKIIKNNIDISGKGIRESTVVLENELPQLTKDLIASTLLLGQGLPNKFSSFSPSGRKELLEKLTNSDFMLEDVKNRVSNRQQEIENKLRDYSNSILVSNTTLNNNKTFLMSKQSDLEYVKSQASSFDRINKLEERLITLNSQIKEVEDKISSYESDLSLAYDSNNQKNIEKTQAIDKLNSQYTEAAKQHIENKSALEGDIKVLKNEISRKKSIKDTCPTCGRKYDGIEKPSTEQDEAILKTKQEELNEVIEKLNKSQNILAQARQDIDNSFIEDFNNIQANISDIKNKITLSRNSLSSLQTNFNSTSNDLNLLKQAKQNYDTKVASLEKQIIEINNEIHSLENSINISESAKVELEAHLSVIKKMESLIKRDFRGYLLTDIIKYIDAKAKEYCQIVFGTTELSIVLNGNALDITYCGKAFDSLSGGEKQRCDIIIQFAIRNLLQSYLNYSSNILILDEIFDNLDKKATTKIIDLITASLNDVESIFVISHHSEELELPIDSSINVIKNEFGVSEIF